VNEFIGDHKFFYINKFIAPHASTGVRRVGTSWYTWSAKILKDLCIFPLPEQRGFQYFCTIVSPSNKTSHPSRGGTCGDVELDAPHTNFTLAAPPII
jgi:hypothetical protein